MKEIDFKEFEKIVFEEAMKSVKDDAKFTHLITKVASKVVTIAIREYHEQLNQED